jgi:hypothetical protein
MRARGFHTSAVRRDRAPRVQHRLGALARDPDVFLPKTVLLPKDGDLFSSSETDCARVRRWWAMMAAFSVSHVVHDDAEDTANTTPIDNGDDDD